ncbi:GNAT family N-acetyltransferase, partial [Vibrio parahaemolyticus]|nr:GNAT family N-acetyltransferase [Vibrio parahaemolyticus]
MDISDYSQVIDLWSTTEAMLLRDADSKENIGKYLKRNPNLSFVALDGDNIIGAILVGTDGRRGYVQHLAVDSTFRGKGVGA